MYAFFGKIPISIKLAILNNLSKNVILNCPRIERIFYNQLDISKHTRHIYHIFYLLILPGSFLHSVKIFISFNGNFLNVDISSAMIILFMLVVVGTAFLGAVTSVKRNLVKAWLAP